MFIIIRDLEEIDKSFFEYFYSHEIYIDSGQFFAIIALACLVNLNVKFTFAKHPFSSVLEYDRKQEGFSMPGFAIGSKIRELRVKNGLTQEELANRSELSKGFISQVESEQTSPSIATLVDILECLGTNLRDFFNETVDEQIVFEKEDYFSSENEELEQNITWVVPNAQKNKMEPILVTLSGGGRSDLHDPHEGEEFGYVLEGSLVLHLGEAVYKVKKGESFYFDPKKEHYIENKNERPAKFLWVSTPPSF